MNLLITGGAGFIGSHLIRHVIDKPEIAKLVNLDCLTYAGNLDNLAGIHDVHPRYQFEKVDLRDKAEVLRVVRDHGITHVMHLAAESHVDRSITGPGDFITTNINGTFHLLEACRNVWETAANRESRTANRFLHVSTDEVYGSLGPVGFFTESSPYAPNSPYAASKAASDMLVRATHHTHGFPALITHCTNNYGPRQHPEKFIPVVIRSIIARAPIPVYGNGLNVRDWLYVEDHCTALWAVLTGGKTGESYNIGGGRELTNVALARLLCEMVDDMRPELGGGSAALISFVADRPGHDHRYAIDAGKIRSHLGWAPVHNLDAALRGTVQWNVSRCVG